MEGRGNKEKIPEKKKKPKKTQQLVGGKKVWEVSNWSDSHWLKLGEGGQKNDN